MCIVPRNPVNQNISPIGNEDQFWIDEQFEDEQTIGQNHDPDQDPDHDPDYDHYQAQYNQDKKLFEEIIATVIENNIYDLEVDPQTMRTIVMNNTGIKSVENVPTYNNNGSVKIIYFNTTDDIININQYDCSMTYYQTIPEIELLLSLT